MGNLAHGNVRLTNAIRTRIANEILRYKFKEASSVLKDLERDAASFALAVYNHVLSEDDRQSLNALPNGWVPEEEDVDVYVGTDCYRLKFNGAHFGVSGWNMRQALKPEPVPETTKRVPYHLRNAFVRLNPRDDLATRLTNLQRRKDEVETDFKRVSVMIHTTLSAATTSNKLKEQWPEAKPFIEKVLGTPAPLPSTSLTVPIASLNELIGLPVPA